ncbi:HlyD family secretion protein [Bordetella petrii]|uniref:HlyD family secretion protein n=1 Tax=Bordetella petrii TaxID=94624 RepID=UPI001E41E2D2|nr:HlyD family secretion protein [Bordetella petrii]MCD0502859.1 HlyD family secretion protein [Bordetella petrii]
MAAGAGVAMIAAIMAIWANRPESASSAQVTDDAYIRADITFVAPEIAGRVEQVWVEENQAVRAGQLLAQIDDRDYALAVRSAQAVLQSAQAAAQGLDAKIEVQHSMVRQARAALDADLANLQLARADYSRYRSLAADGSGTVQARQQAQARLRVLQAQHAKDDAILQAEAGRLEVLRADLQRAQAEMQRADAALAQARLDLAHTRIVAPIDGTVGRKQVRVGNFARVGEPFLTLVPLADIYVEANFRETQLARMREGQPVRFTVDALPGREFTGKVASLGPASGVSYSAIAPHNATGNFTKIVQRLPVRISVNRGQSDTDLLRVGMSVLPEVDVSAE